MAVELILSTQMNCKDTCQINATEDLGSESYSAFVMNQKENLKVWLHMSMAAFVRHRN